MLTLIALAAMVALSSCERKANAPGTLRLPLGASEPIPAASAPTMETHVADLTTALEVELKATAKYAAFARQASAEGLPEIALLFQATAKSEAVHASNHQAALEEFGAPIPQVFPDFNLGKTEENLRAAIAGEGDEVDQLYPEFIARATEVHAEMGLQSLKYSYKSELKHKALYDAAIVALQAHDLSKLPDQYYVCPTCGNLIADSPHKRCDISMTSSDKFLLINRLAI